MILAKEKSLQHPVGCQSSSTSLYVWSMLVYSNYNLNKQRLPVEFSFDFCVFFSRENKKKTKNEKNICCMQLCSGLDSFFSSLFSSIVYRNKKIFLPGTASPKRRTRNRNERKKTRTWLHRCISTFSLAQRESPISRSEREEKNGRQIPKKRWSVSYLWESFSFFSRRKGRRLSSLIRIYLLPNICFSIITPSIIRDARTKKELDCFCISTHLRSTSKREEVFARPVEVVSRQNIDLMMKRKGKKASLQSEKNSKTRLDKNKRVTYRSKNIFFSFFSSAGKIVTRADREREKIQKNAKGSRCCRRLTI